MRARVRDVRFFRSPCTTRLPFRFGVVTMTRAPMLTARVELETEAGQPAVGHSAELLVPKWFEKDPDTPVEDDWRSLEASAAAAAEAFRAAGEDTVFGLWRAAYRARVEAVPLGTPDRLTRGFGVALVERAVLDAACRAAGLSFFDALREDLFRVVPGDAHAELAGTALADVLPARPLERVLLRHTVGLADPLTPEEVPAELRGDDGHPLSLVDDVRAYGLTAFKLKVGGDPDADVARLAAIGAVLRGEVDRRLLVTIDGNEQYAEPERLADVLERARGNPDGAFVVDALVAIEQPVPRALTFDPATRAGVARLAAHAPVLIDEADAGLEAFPRALELGYRGVSTKNCKGVLRALLAHALCVARGDGAFQTAEDLTNLPVLPLQQDLATVAALGLEHVERNGHHYFPGLAHLPPGEARAACAAHPDLYVEDARGPRLRVEGGALRLESLACTGYGYDLEIDTASREPV